jgi:hypothetical protein
VSKKRPPDIVGPASDSIAHATLLAGVVEEQERLWLSAVAQAQGPEAVTEQLGRLDAEFRALSGQLGQIAPVLELSRFYGWYWRAVQWPPERVMESAGRKRARIDALVGKLTGTPPWELIPFEDANASFIGDTARLDPPEFLALEAALEEVLAVHGSALIGTKWMLKITDGDGLYEFRIDNDLDQIQRRTGSWGDDLDDADEDELDEDELDLRDEGEEEDREEDTDVLLRVFFIFDGRRVIVLLHGYDKGEADSKRRQHRAIDEGKARAARYRQQKARLR